MFIISDKDFVSAFEKKKEKKNFLLLNKTKKDAIRIVLHIILFVNLINYK